MTLQTNIIFAVILSFLAVNYVVVFNLFALVLLQTVTESIQQCGSLQENKVLKGIHRNIISILSIVMAGVALLTVYNIVF